ncbi:MAG TPA: hypothetical protein VFG10_20775 [Saprospiraceae bacterium]|nr:hypothetical protein [Saprospiraceae bacterium]
MKHAALIFTITMFILNLIALTPVHASPLRGDNPLNVLRNEISKIIRDKVDLSTTTFDDVVTVGFLINARNELIILDVNGDSEKACTHVKQVLNYTRVKYNQARQLTRYSIKIHLVGGK